jgi:F-type H+-transporting ATPase subunit gamma
MNNLIDIKERISQVGTLQHLVDAYEEIASIRMKKIRNSVLTNRYFQDEINMIFDQLRVSYAKEVATLAKKRKGKETITFLPHNGKVVSVLLSANTGLYGDITIKTFQLFIQEAKKGLSELTIVGRQGLSQYLSEGLGRPYTYFDLPDYGQNKIQLAEIVKHIVQYEEIHVYYGKYRNVIYQDPMELMISAQISLSGKSTEKPVSYLFEPSLEKILMFFETEIFASLFEQSVIESQLAKFASRFLAMDRATSNIKEEMKKLGFERMRTIHGSVNRKQLNSLSSLYFLGKQMT